MKWSPFSCSISVRGTALRGTARSSLGLIGPVNQSLSLDTKGTESTLDFRTGKMAIPSALGFLPLLIGLADSAGRFRREDLNCNELDVIAVGVVGVGKSSLINALLGLRSADDGE